MNRCAEVQYDPFGNTVSTSGTMAELFFHRFSTKYWDPETDLYYYGHRFYNPSLGRWVSRDPASEASARNLMLFCSNDGMARVDPRGLRDCHVVFVVGHGAFVRDHVEKAGRETPLCTRYAGFACGSSKEIPYQVDAPSEIWIQGQPTIVYDGEQVIAEVDGAGTMTRSYVWGPGIDNLLGFAVYAGGTTNRYFCLTDHLGTVHAIVDQGCSVVESYRYDAWGRVDGVFDSEGAALSESALGNRYLWQGREYSWKSGLYYFRARWYDPITGRWLSNDPIGISGGLNQYVFGRSSPIAVVDPFGLQGLGFAWMSNGGRTVAYDHTLIRWDLAYHYICSLLLRPLIADYIYQHDYVRQDTCESKGWQSAWRESAHYTYDVGWRWELMEEAVPYHPGVDPSDLWADWYGSNWRLPPDGIGMFDWPAYANPPGHGNPPAQPVNRTR